MSERDDEYVRGQADLLADLREQLHFLRSSSEAYDAGVEIEAKRLAVVLRTLVHHAVWPSGKGSHALLVQLEIRDSIQWLSTSRVDARNLLDRQLALCGLQSVHDPDEGTLELRYVPMLDQRLERVRLLPFAEWWREPVIRVPDDEGSHRLYSRGDLVRTAANKDGGAHVDPTIPRHHWDLAGGLSSSWQIGDETGTTERRAVPGVGATLRQVAWETVGSLSWPLTCVRAGSWHPGTPFPYEELRPR